MPQCPFPSPPASHLEGMCAHTQHVFKLTRYLNPQSSIQLPALLGAYIIAAPEQLGPPILFTLPQASSI